MANYSITYSCGHSGDKQLFGKHDDRQRYIAWAAKSASCPACGAKDKAAALEALEAEHVLPNLTGSEKQVSWGRTIRAEKIAEMQQYFSATQARVPADKMAGFEEQVSVVRQVVAGKTSASYWIDNQHLTGRAVAEAAFRAARS